MTYDGLGRLEVIGTSTQVIWGPSGEKLGYLVSGTLVSSLKLPGGGEASYNGSSLTSVRHKDWLGSSRLATTWSHGILSKTAYAPFGETYNTSGRADGDFTGMTEDASTDLADFPARKYDANAGRWTVPDPGAWSVVDYKHPQSFNRYAYARNNPLKFTDPVGLTICQYGNNNDGSPNYEEADDEAECSDNGGTYFEAEQTVTATADAEDDEGNVDWDIDQEDATIDMVGFAPRAPNDPASFSTCVTDGADSISIAGIAHQNGLGGGVSGFVVDAVGGNAFSGATNLIKSMGPSGEAGDHSVFYNMGQSIVAGPTQGFGALFRDSLDGTAFAADVVDAATVAVAGAAAASGIGAAKLAYDGLSTLAAAIDCTVGVIK